MKIKNKYNIGDIVWINFSNAEPTQHKVVGLDIFIDDDYSTLLRYKLDGLPIDIIGFLEKDCYLTKEECMQKKHYGEVKATAIRMNSVFIRLLLIISMFLLVLPITIIQVVHFFFTGRKEPFTYRIMAKINDKLDNV